MMYHEVYKCARAPGSYVSIPVVQIAMIHDRVFPWLRRLSDRLRYRSQSVQYELQRMTPKGGWQNYYTDPEGRHADAFPTPPPQPSFGPDTGYYPGRYRCLRRVDGRIESILWTVESSDADEFYAEWREDVAAETEATDATATDGGSATDSGAGDATGTRRRQLTPTQTMTCPHSYRS